MKTYNCTICGEQVSHRKSFSMGDGKRACRSHEQAQTKASELAEIEKQQKSQQQKIKEEKASRTKPLATLNPRCFICGQEGLRQDVYFTRWLVEQNKCAVLQGRAPHPFDLEQMSVLADMSCLYFVRWDGENARKRVKYPVYQTILTMQSMFGKAVLLCCRSCCKELQFTTIAEEMMEKLTFKDLVAVRTPSQV